MLTRLLQRVLYTLPVIWLVVSLVFLLIHLVPGDPIAQMLGEGAPAADIAATRHTYGLDAPLGDNTSTTGKASCTATSDGLSATTRP
jgi:ABC-type dipeptide/oligopeptide/nickel transport system permease component